MIMTKFTNGKGLKGQFDRRHDIQPNDIQRNDIQHNYIEYNNI